MNALSAANIITGARAQRVVLHYTQNVRTLHTIDVDMDVTVEVFGDPENGAYEWLIRRLGVVEMHSDAGYGICAIALRDGLNAFFREVGP